MKLILNELNRDPKQFKPKMIRNRISDAKNRLIDPGQYRQLSGSSTVQRVISDVYEIYDSRLREANAMDFDDLLIKPIELFRMHPDVLEKYQQHYRYILIDEYQDTNHAQYVVTKMLAAGHQNLCVVGDDAQSIYSFRGADISNILNFKKDYPDAREVPLEQNYRSTKFILQCADSIIKRNEGQLDKTLWTGNEEGEPVTLLENFDERDEASRVVEHIKNVQYRTGQSFNEFAILYRTNYQSRAFEEALRRRDVAYQVVGGMSFYQRKEIKDVLAYLTLLVNPHNEQAILRVINEPARGIGKKSLTSLLQRARSTHSTLWTILQDPEAAGIYKPAIPAIRSFTRLIEETRVELDRGMSLSKVLQDLMKQTGYLRAMAEEQTPESLSRRENVLELQNALAFYESSVQNPTLQSYLQEISLITDTDKYDENKPAVTLMTVHASKGLEFSAVWIVGLEENLFPIAPRDGEEENLEEERRLFYVAITRAKKQLFLSHCKQRYKFGEEQIQLRSRFLDEVDAGVVRTETGATIRQKKGAFGYRVDGGGGRGGGGGAASPGVSRGESADGPSFDWSSPLPTGRPGSKKGSKSSSPYRIEYDPEEAGSDPFVVGAEVMHHRFGPGKILQREELGSKTKVVVFFKSHGQKTLRLWVAKLQLL